MTPRGTKRGQSQTCVLRILWTVSRADCPGVRSQNPLCLHAFGDGIGQPRSQLKFQHNSRRSRVVSSVIALADLGWSSRTRLHALSCRKRDSLKQPFTSAPVLVHFDPDKPIFIKPDASNLALGCVSCQESTDGSIHLIASSIAPLSLLETVTRLTIRK
ncbi:hypothetical protein BCR37DRAFT_255909 [Protomyces lactucae-debilis]|uniref:Reverse transcriptase/retrotransposon-derived protein RNase H-like domain-containing protein n=1 Tax=Protomyces lactucae-debilis TaxID=2754530 RepID=A0A1Y2FLZ4_PROLT|nr:uncharacterized protein BCR37DRAFT_255909 [Protomyces lactucae-debilis]ORY84990.1 hypothetical protein BCR37DRAFT_255909 [Protomyces lactucae-debilis]